MDSYEHIPVSLPSHIVQASSGFSLDIGCSTAKLIYRSNEDYTDGKPKDKELQEDTGRVFLIPCITRTNLTDVIELVKRKCDLIRTSGHVTEVITTGAGCNLFRKKLEDGLDIKLNNQMEFECFIQGWKHLVQTRAYQQLFHPVSQEGIHKAEWQLQKVMGMLDKVKDTKALGNTKVFEDMLKDVAVEESTEPLVYPCLMAMCGSGAGIMKVDEDGMFEFVEGLHFAGRTFLGMVALMTGIKDYSRVLSALRNANGRSCDEYQEDLMCADVDSAGDGYAMFAELESKANDDLEDPPMALGKAVTLDRSSMKDEDIIYSVYRQCCFTLAQVATAAAVRTGVKNIYFCGNFVENEVARMHITKEAYLRSRFILKGQEFNVRFIKHGGHLGAVGAFMKAMGVKEKNAEDKTD